VKTHHGLLQACNILLPEAQALIQQGAPGENVCTKENGWFKPDTAARVRDVISKEVKRCDASFF